MSIDSLVVQVAIPAENLDFVVCEDGAGQKEGRDVKRGGEVG